MLRWAATQSYVQLGRWTGEVKELIPKGIISSDLVLTLTSAIRWSKGQNANHNLS